MNMEEQPAVENAPVETPDVDKLLDNRLAEFEKSIKSSIFEYVKNAHAENIKLGEMNDTEKASYELEQKLKEVEDMKSDIERRELKLKGLEILEKQGMDKGLVEILSLENEESLKRSAEILQKSFNTALEKAITEKLKGETPKVAVEEPPSEASKFASDLAKRFNIKGGN